MKAAGLAVLALGLVASAFVHPIAVLAAILLPAATALVLEHRVSVVLVVVLVLAADLGLRVDAAPSWHPSPEGQRHEQG